MPVTAKLSRAFYERFGEQVVNELVEWFNQVDATYRADLRELNESNFARFDAKLEQLRAEVRAEFAAGLRSLEGLIHRELREQTRFMVGIMVALWTALVIPVVGLWFR